MLLVGFAFAHVPHSVLGGAAPGPAWWAVLDAGEASVVYRSDDGHLWSAVPAAPTEDNLRGLVGLEDGTVVILAEHRVWWSADGVTWEDAAVEGEPVGLAVAGDDVLVHTSAGVYVGRPGALTLRAGSYVAIGGGAAPVRVYDDGVAWVGDTSWTLPVGPDEVQSVYAGDALYLGTTGGAVWRGDGAWTACGVVDVDPKHPEIAAVAGDLVAVTADGRLFTSEDACATWTRITTPFRVDFGGGGGAADVAEAVASVVVTDTDVVLAGWDGLVRGPDWTQETVLPPDYVRGLAVGADGAFYLGTYVGVLRSYDGGATWDAPLRGATDANVQRVAADPLDPAELWAVINHEVYRSVDYGADWELIPSPYETVVDVAVTGVPWVIGDGGASWYDGAWHAAVDGARHVFFDGDTLCASTVVGTRCSDDRGATWTDRVEADLLTASGPVALREDTILYDGLPVLDAGFDAFRNLARLPGGDWYASTRGSRIYRSVDGRSWELVPVTLPAAPSILLPVGDALLLGTYDGAFALRDGVLERFGAYQAVVGGSGFDVCVDCSVREDACGWRNRVTEVHGSLAVDLRGDHIHVREASGDGHLEVDGVVFDGWDADGAEGWHEVRLVGEVRFEAVEASGPGAVLDPAEAPRPDRCGVEPESGPRDGACGGCGGDAWVVVPMLLLGRRRRDPW